MYSSCTHPVHQVTLPAEHLGVVLGDLASSRRAHVQEVGEDVEEERVVSALAPLACLAVRTYFGLVQISWDDPVNREPSSTRMTNIR